ncbi:DNA ligase I [Colletotrichum scovillei]|uniref:DNA ligase n=1 Tax=Colletotrichum scovillei TaxID=1209932 RepID=A0A9P7QU67_9PEZI|nr:DNA ligase I [Colletotrichum scovillei]KAF4775277.1 DNA ligase I [Colletotrichum scovillei]KAG7042648.1 DNA ligase 1 [Colletotrichum scovillei]KAG7043238.1 DNA ligase 1 [Colletotrichum scovillei]KAG7062685.1 DNA ligase 1 [Colletotrichum scovillei]
MPSPSKKRKLNDQSSTGVPSRGLEYFFSKQKQNGTSSPKPTTEPAPEAIPNGTGSADQQPELTDEELARKLQAEWDAEVQNERAESTPCPEPAKDPSSRSNETNGEEPIEANSGLKGSLTSSVLPIVTPKTKTLSLSSVANAEDTVSATIPLDQSPLTFDPSEFVPQLKESWAAEGGHASYAFLTRCFILVSATQSRIKIVDTLVNCIRVLIEADPESLLPAVWLATNSISPPYISLELGLGGSAISKALKQVCGLDGRSLKTLYDKHGDAGDVAFEAKKKQSFTLRKPKPLTIKAVYQSLVKIANSQGHGSGEAKQRIVDRLLQDARGGEESRFIVRTLCQHLRIGAVKTTMLIALSRAFLLSRPPGAEFPLRSVKDLQKLKKEELAEVWSRPEEILKACFARRPNYNDLVPVLLEIGVSDELLLRCDLTLHIPLRPMLGSITRDLSEMLTKLQGRDFACEFKYDGQRAQIHCDESGKISIFSRHLELMTDKYPDLVALMPKVRGEGVNSFVMEGEVVAVDSETGDLKNFQTLSNRARKDVAIGSVQVNVCMFAFDLMFLNGQPLLNRPFRERRELLRSMFIEVPRQFTWVKSLDATSQDSDAVLEFFKAATDIKCEGIMVKILDNLTDVPYQSDGAVDADGEVAEEPRTPSKSKSRSKGAKDEEGAPKKKGRRKPLLATYEPDKRLDSWLKVKKDYNSSFETLDMIPVAAWHGQGRKSKWWSPILMAVRNEDSGALEVVCKCMSGFTDAFYKANREHYDDGELAERQNTRTQKPAFVEYSGPEPDVWFEPQEVWEMAFADITLSPTYTAAIGLVSDERGLSLRFPRFLKKREDKSMDEASTNEFLAGLWRKQEAKAPTKEGQADVVDEFEE